ncbi:MAG: hypothetical protein WBF58_18645 [Xanthobacteraceae bacterium]
MTRGVVTYIRTVLAFAIGAGIDLILFADTYPYGERYQHQSLVGISISWLGPLLTFLCSFVLDFKRRDPRRESSAPGWIAKFDSLALLIPSAIVIGLTITHTIVLIRDVTIDPTTHSLFPFEYILAWVTVGVPAVAGSMLARAFFWVFSRFRVQ